MSFFGFDTTLPRDTTRGGARGGHSSSDDPFNPLGGDLDDGRELQDDELDAKIKGLTAGAQEDVEIYEWGGEGYDGLGDMLDEAGDDLNDDTFGGSSAAVGKDFDFGHGAAQPNQQQQVTKKPMDSMFASNFDDFWALPSFGGGQRQQQQQQVPPPVPQLQAPAVSQYEHQAPPTAPARSGLTMEEIEAELRAARVSQQQQQQQPPPPSQPAGPPGRHQMSVEEIEAQMRGGQHRHAGPPLPYQQQQQQGMFPQGMPPGMPPQFAAMMQGQQGQYRGQPHPSQQPFPPPTGPAGPKQDRLDSDFPPLGAPPPPGADSSPPPPTHSNIPLHRPQQPMPGPPPPVLSAEALREQDEQRLARMRALLNALPEPVQQGIISLPPQMHFDVLMGISREFPVLLEPQTALVEDAQKQAQEGALRRLGKFAEVRNKIAQREAKIAAMSRYNNVMSVSDKEFITRIQISQIITADPYADDFYAHIYFALRNNRSLVNPGLMGAPPGAAGPGPNQQQQQQPPKGPKGSKGSQRMNAQQKAMLRMQQQVERLVADRKQRIEKATSGNVNPNLQGALGKVGGNSASNPRKALQISKGGEDGDGKTNGESAADAVRQALEGASLGGRGGDGNASADGRRAPLTRHESLRILEKLYDTVLSLEQLRRSLDGPEAGQAAAREQQEALVATLWKELRILEPLEISDPHPFVSLLGTTKGKRLLPRALRHLSSEQTLTALTMIVASFDTLDVVREAAVLDDVSSFIPGAAPTPSPVALTKRRDVEEQSELFGTTIVPAMLILMGSSPMKIVIGMLALFVERNDVVKVVRSRAGIAFLTILLSRAATLRSQTSASTADGGDAAAAGATPEEQAQWSSIFQLLFERLVTGSGGLSNLFPSSRAKSNLPFGLSSYLLQQSSNPLASNLQSHLDEVDEPIWNLYAALAINATSSNSMEQQSILVQELREKILENVLEARNKRDTLDGERKLRLVNIFLNALNLDASQITF